MNNDIYIRRGPRPQPQNRGIGPGMILLLVAAVIALGVVMGLKWLRERKTAAESVAPALAPADAVPATAPQPAPAPSAAPAPAVHAAPAVRLPPAPASSAPGSDPAMPAFMEARSLQAAGQIPAAREKALGALAAAKDPALQRQIEDLLGQIHTALIFTPSPMAEKVDYTIQPGDRLAGIAKQHGTTIELVTRGNGIKSAVIRPGDRLRILSGKFSILVDKSDNELVLSLNDRFFKRYRVGTGKFEKTPAGQFKITDRIAQPTWWRPDGKAVPFGDKENVLGTHWLSLDVPGYGLHGTWEPDTVGKQESAGCIRLVNADIEELFTLLPVGTPVVIQE